MPSLIPEANIATFTNFANNNAQTVVYLTTKDKIISAISIADVIRPESKQAIEELNKMGIEVAMRLPSPAPMSVSPSNPQA